MSIAFTWLLLLAPSLLIVATAGAEAPALSKARTVKLALNWKPEPQFGGFYAAELSGHFTKAGVNVEILPGGAGTPVVQMIAAGKVEFGIASADEVVISRARGGDVVALFATYQTNPQGIMAHTTKNYGSLKELFADPSTTVAMQKGLPYAIHLMGKYPNPKARVVPYQGGITSFIADTNFAQQCFVTSEPLEAKRRGLSLKTFLVADEGYNPYTTVLITRGEVVKRDPQLVRALVAAVRSGWNEYLADPQSVNRRMRELNPSMDEVTFKESAAAQKALIETNQARGKTLGKMTEDRWRDLAKQLLEMKVISKPVEVSGLYRNE